MVFGFSQVKGWMILYYESQEQNFLQTKFFVPIQRLSKLDTVNLSLVMSYDLP